MFLLLVLLMLFPPFGLWQILPIENLNIVYADMNDFVAYNVKKRDITEWIRSRIKEIEDSLSSRRTPDGETSGLCKYCKYQTKCHYDGNGLTEQPRSIPKMLKFPSSHTQQPLETLIAETC
jgi:hypothetical protein